MAEAARTMTAPGDNLTVNTSRFGAITVEEEKVITLTSPFPGFPESHRFIVRRHSNKSPFMWLQSLDNPGLAFVVIPAEQLVPSFKPELPGPALRELGKMGDKNLEMLLILAIPKGKPEQMTANLLGPVLINPATRRAKQVLLDPAKYEANWPVFEPEEN